MNTATEFRNEPVWDKAHSTFVRVIYLKNGYTLTGYSKKVGRNERRDKIDLLTNWILRDFKNGYLDKSTTNSKLTPTERVEYCFRDGNSLESIFTLYYDFPEWSSTRWMENKKLTTFINRFYNLIRKGSSASSIVNELEIRTRAPKHDPLDYTMMRFSNMADLNAYTARLSNESDLPREAVDNFYRKYKEKHFNL